MVSLIEANELMAERTSNGDELNFAAAEDFVEGDYELEIRGGGVVNTDKGRVLNVMMRIIPDADHPNIPANAGVRIRLAYNGSDKQLDFQLRIYRQLVYACGYDAGSTPADTDDLVGKRVMARITLNTNPNTGASYPDINQIWACPESGEHLMVSETPDGSVFVGVTRRENGGGMDA